MIEIVKSIKDGMNMMVQPVQWPLNPSGGWQKRKCPLLERFSRPVEVDVSVVDNWSEK